MIEKLIEKTEVVKTQVWEAFDGKIFNSQSECEKYENSAAAMLVAKLQEIVINDNPKSSMLDDGGEAEFLTIVPVTQEHLDTMNQLHFMFGGHGKEEKDSKFISSDLGKPFILGYRLYNADYEWIWFYELDLEVTTVTNGKFKLVPNEED